MLIAGISAAAAGSLATLGMLSLTGLAAFYPLLFAVEKMEDYLSTDHVAAYVQLADGHFREVRERDLGALGLEIANTFDGWSLTIAHRTGRIGADGGYAAQLASQLLAQLNRAGASDHQVREAVAALTAVGTPRDFIIHSARLHESRRQSGAVFMDSRFGAFGLTDLERLALEMAVNEESERHAMEGELLPLQEAWHNAEEIAAIADGLLIPLPVQHMLSKIISDHGKPHA